MRSPLARLRLLVEIARQEPGRDVLGEIEGELVSMDALVEDLLAGSRLDFGALSRRALDPVEIAKRAVERLGPDGPPVETSGAPAAVRADPTLLGRALTAVCDNARKHGGGAKRLLVRTTDRAVAFVVEDEGPGFRSEDLPRVFETLFQGEARAGGLGLGLALVSRIAVGAVGRSVSTLATIACTVDPPKGGSPTSISYVTAPSE